MFFLFQNSVQGMILHLVSLSPQSPLVCDSFIVFLITFTFLRRDWSVVSRNLSLSEFFS